jgi:MoxR-like ATPase
MGMKINSKEAVKFIIAAMKANLVTMISGSPGIGKSAIVQQIADQYNLELIDVRLSQCDPTDLKLQRAS